MSVSDIVAWIGGVVIGATGFIVLPRVWNGWFDRREVRFRGEMLTHGELIGTWWPFGPGGWRAAARAMVPIFCGVWAMILAAAASAVDDHLKGAAWAAVRGVFITLAVAALASLVLALILMLFNWPKFIVPPYMRDEPGLLAARKARQRIR
jgi:hypothetical protein